MPVCQRVRCLRVEARHVSVLAVLAALWRSRVACRYAHHPASTPMPRTLAFFLASEVHLKDDMSTEKASVLGKQGSVSHLPTLGPGLFAVRG